MKFIDQAGCAGRLMLGDFFHEGPVIKCVDLFKFPLLGGDFELQGMGAHSLILYGRGQVFAVKTQVAFDNKAWPTECNASALRVNVNFPSILPVFSSNHAIKPWPPNIRNHT
jgi:hypothetical protein